MTQIPDNSKLEGSRYMPISDEEIMAYADGVLAPDRRPAVRKALAEDPALMEKLESFLFTRERLARVFDGVLTAPIPERLLEPFETPPTPTPTPRRLRDLFTPGKRKRAFVGVRAASFAAAMVCAVLLGAWLAAYAARYGIVSFDPYEFVLLDEQGLLAMPQLQQGLERTADGETARLSRKLSVKLADTYRNKDREWCRSFGLIYASGTKGHGLACRDGSGAWRIEAAHVTKHYELAGVGPQTNEAAEANKARLGLQKVEPKDAKDLLESGWPAPRE